MTKEIFRVFRFFSFAFITLFFSACGGGGGTSSTSVDTNMQKIDGKWDPYFSDKRFLSNQSGAFVGQATWYEEKLKDDGSVDTDATGEMTFIFNSYGKVSLSIEILSPIEIGTYDIDSQGRELTISSLKVVYELVENAGQNCVKVSKLTDGNFDSYYNLCQKFN
ncbi:hypothetical protein ACH5BF_13410 [Arcobacter sp. YIC-464]|uniref:hypothetical protein n=1 Tax=Arcobacter sp. YIC-464 TaxID=3376631 RepID=UPI003C2693B5